MPVWARPIAHAGVAMSLPLPGFFQVSIAILWVAAFASSTQDICGDGIYLTSLDKKTQAQLAGVQGMFWNLGKVLATGPGNAMSAPTELSDEPWKIGAPEPRYMPLQAQIGDYAIFFRRAAVEITFEGERYLVVPQAAILTLVREDDPDDDSSF